MSQAKKYRIADAARADLLDIWSYVFEFNESDRRADAAIDDLMGVINELAAYPNLGKPRDKLGAGLLAFPKSGYLIVYRVGGPGIEVTRVTGADEDVVNESS